MTVYRSNCTAVQESETGNRELRAGCDWDAGGIDQFRVPVLPNQSGILRGLSETKAQFRQQAAM